MTFTRYLLAGLLGLALVAGPAWAGEGRTRLDNFLHGLHTFKANFEQSVLDTENARTGLYRGVFYLERPGRFRWNYVSPYEQSVIADGRDVWVVDKDLEQITQQSQRSALKGTPAQLLSDTEAVDKHFEIVEIGPSQGLEWLELLPRDEDSQFVRILLAFDKDTLKRMEMSDKFGQITRFHFSEAKRNPTLSAKLFEFHRPDGFDIFTQ